MLAEADMEINQGVTDLSKQMIKRVRERAFVNASNKDEMVDGYLNKISTYDQMKQAIMDERAWEFAGEAIRKWDLIRRIQQPDSQHHGMVRKSRIEQPAVESDFHRASLRQESSGRRLGNSLLHVLYI